MKQPEQISKTSLLNAKNLYKLLVFLRGEYPNGYSFDGLKRQLDIEIFLEFQLKDLRIDGLIRKRDLNLPKKLKDTLNPNFLKLYPEYVITSKGMEFINSIDVRDLNRNIKLLTIVLVLFGAITILVQLFS